MVTDKVVDFKKAGKRIKIARIERDWSQEVLAERADISVTHLSNIENACSKASISTFVKIANALNCGVDDLLCDSIKDCRKELDSQIARTYSSCTDYEIRVISGAVNGILQSIRDADEYTQRIDSR